MYHFSTLKKISIVQEDKSRLEFETGGAVFRHVVSVRQIPYTHYILVGPRNKFREYFNYDPYITPSTLLLVIQILTGYMALYKRLFGNITRAVRRRIILQTTIYIRPFNLSEILITNL
jgi:hypothetical protein